MSRFEVTLHERKKTRNIVIAVFGGFVGIYGAAVDEWPIVVVGGLIPVAVLVKGLLHHMKKQERGIDYSKHTQL